MHSVRKVVDNSISTDVRKVTIGRTVAARAQDDGGRGPLLRDHLCRSETLSRTATGRG